MKYIFFGELENETGAKQEKEITDHYMIDLDNLRQRQINHYFLHARIICYVANVTLETRIG